MPTLTPQHQILDIARSQREGLRSLADSRKSQLTVVGTNHKRAPIDVRERLSCPQQALPIRLKSLLQHEGFNEAVILSTCNRTEVYAACSHNQGQREFLTGMLSEWSGIPVADLNGKLYALNEEEAVTHLFKVASGLDSLVVGEPQIQGQVREAAKTAIKVHAAGRILGDLFRRAQNVASRIRKETGFGFEKASVSSAAIALLKKEANGRPIHSILFIGAGKMITLAADGLSQVNHTEVLFANRTLQRAEELAERFTGRPLAFNQIPLALEKVDAVLSCTSAADYIITADQLRGVIEKRSSRPLIFIDAAVPRNIDPASAHLPGVQLFNIDDLGPFVKATQESIQPYVTSAERLIEQEVQNFYAHLRAYNANDTLKDLRRIAEQIREGELSRALRRMGHVTAREKEIVDLLTKRIINKLLYEPTARLKEHASNSDGETYEAIIRELFAIDQEIK